MRPWALLLALPLTLGGCLIPQPDTPPIPPGAPLAGASKTGVGAPNAARPSGSNPDARASATVSEEHAVVGASPTSAASSAPMPAPSVTGDMSNNAGGVTGAGTQPGFVGPGMEPPSTAFVPKAAPGQLTVNFSGNVPREVWLVAVDGTAEVGPKLDADGFTLGLAAGDYWLEIVSEGKRLRSRTPLNVPSGGDRKLEVAVQAGQLVVEETVPLDEQPKPEPSASAAP